MTGGRLLAQVLVLDEADGQVGQADAKAGKHPFSFPTQPADVTEALEDFQRFSKREAWERAFKALEKLNAADAKGLVLRRDGVLVPSRVLARQLLGKLPAAGKNAYRLFHDAEAKALLEQATGAEEAAKLNKIINSYLITSVGDAAADRLGDLSFEQGNMNAAVEAWQTVLRYCPDTALPRVRLLTKTAIALARAGRWSEFQEILRQVATRHAGEMVDLGGKRVAAVDHLQALAADSKQPELAINTEPVEEDFELPQSNEPLWQFRALGKTDPNHPHRGLIMGNPNNWGRQQASDMILPTAVDDKRAYANLLGIDIGLDLQTGKLLWRSGRFHDLPQKTQNQYYVQPEGYSIAANGGRVWTVSREVEQIGHHAAMFRLISRDGATGKELSNSKNASDLQAWSFVGKPLRAGERIYATAFKQHQGSELFALGVGLKDFKLLWSTQLGTHQMDHNQMHNVRSPQPDLLLSGEKLYVETHAGGFAELNAADGALNWGLAYDCEMPDPNRSWNQPAKLCTVGEPRLLNGLAYFKGLRSPRLYALNLAGPSVLWKRSVLDSAMLVGLDDERIFLGGEELTAYDLRTQKLLWANKLPLATGWTRPVLTKNRVYQFTSRGVYQIDKATGAVMRLFRGADLESVGGAIILTPHAVLTVSNLAITAYPRSRK